MKTIMSVVLQSLPNCVLTLQHPTLPPTDADWDEHLQTLLFASQRLSVGDLREIVFTDGPGPNAKQRRVASSFPAANRYFGYIVTPDRAMRGIVTAISWLGVKLKVYAPEKVGDALRALGASVETELEIARLLQQHSAALGGGAH